MTTIYFKNECGKRISAEVSDKVAAGLAEMRKSEWRNDAKKRYYSECSLNAMSDKDARTSLDALNPENICIAAEEENERGIKLTAALKSLTREQMELVNLLCKGLTVTEIADRFDVSKAAVTQMRSRIQERFKNFLRNPLTKGRFSSDI